MMEILVVPYTHCAPSPPLPSPPLPFLHLPTVPHPLSPQVQQTIPPIQVNIGIVDHDDLCYMLLCQYMLLMMSWALVCSSVHDLLRKLRNNVTGVMS